MDNVIKFPNLERDTFIKIICDNKLPYRVYDENGKLLGYTLKSNKHGIYLTDVRFRVDGGSPVIEGVYKGDVHISHMASGYEVIYDHVRKVFCRYDNGNLVEAARMVIVYDGVIYVTIDIG